jgi:predicted HTH transcriptional regulator
MEPQELRLMLKDLESDLIERKASLSDPDRIRQAICAFANDHPFLPADGAIGSHQNAVFEAEDNFEQIALEIARRCGVTIEKDHH